MLWHLYKNWVWKPKLKGGRYYENYGYNVLTAPVLMIDEEMKVKGRVADINEIELLR